VEDLNEDMEDLIIEVMAEADTKLREGGLTGDTGHGYAGVSSISSAPIFIVK
jgi:hypothetical protein